MGIPDLGGTFLTQNAPPDNVIEVRCRPISTKYLHLNPFISSYFPEDRKKESISITEGRRRVENEERWSNIKEP
jgi:hypothetical protein